LLLLLLLGEEVPEGLGVEFVDVAMGELASRISIIFRAMLT
jgi:hypothetical protein